MSQRAFDSSYTAVTKDGGEWLAERTGIKLIGIDYLSVAHYADLIGPHIAILSKVILHSASLAAAGNMYTSSISWHLDCRTAMHFERSLQV